MDKINLARWEEIFSKTEHQVVFHSDRYTDLRFRFEEPGLAVGRMHTLSAPGMRLTDLFMQADRPLCLADEEAGEAVESVFVLEGDAESQFVNLNAPLLFRERHHNLQYNKHFGGRHQVSPRFRAMTISYDLPFVEDLCRNSSNRALEALAENLQKKAPYLATQQALFWDMSMAGVISAMHECRFGGSMRYLFLESKMMELFALQMEQAALSGFPKQKDKWMAEDREKLAAIKEYVSQHYLEVFSLKDLTYRFGLNEFKLKKGYRQLFGITVFGDVHRLRMQKAQELMSQQEMNVSEAAYFIGYNNVSSFCTEFRKRFGYSPGKMKRA